MGEVALNRNNMRWRDSVVDFNDLWLVASTQAFEGVGSRENAAKLQSISAGAGTSITDVSHLARLAKCSPLVILVWKKSHAHDDELPFVAAVIKPNLVALAEHQLQSNIPIGGANPQSQRPNADLANPIALDAEVVDVTPQPSKLLVAELHTHASVHLYICKHKSR
jgi:hypothetical protein